jgi:hypothetical protein
VDLGRSLLGCCFPNFKKINLEQNGTFYNSFSTFFTSSERFSLLQASSVSKLSFSIKQKNAKTKTKLLL